MRMSVGGIWKIYYRMLVILRVLSSIIKILHIPQVVLNIFVPIVFFLYCMTLIYSII